MWVGPASLGSACLLGFTNSPHLTFELALKGCPQGGASVELGQV